MIVELSAEQLAIIERAFLSLGPGFTALTGETGAGKSLLIDAIELALGERADADLVRAGASRATVSLVVEVPSGSSLEADLGEIGVVPEDGRVFVQRDVSSEGRSTARVNGRQIPVGSLKRLGRMLVDLHGQHDHQSLMHPETHLGTLDDWTGLPVASPLAAVQSGWAEVSELRRRLEQNRQGERFREQRADMLRFQVQELEQFGPRVGEQAELEAQLSRLKNVERLAQAVGGAMAPLAEDEANALDALAAAIKSLEDGARFDPALADLASGLNEAQVLLDEARYGLSHYADTLEANPDLLEEIASRLDHLKRLFRKYGESEEALVAFLEEAQRELDELEGSGMSQEALVEALAAAEVRLASACAVLTDVRQESGKRFSETVQTQLQDLAMDRARFEVRCLACEPGPTGADAVEFMFSANVGEPLKPLAKIASGGEISRVMLAIKTAMAGRAGIPTLIFDEVDAGLGGRAAAAVARKLRELAEHRQVIVISHSPQIASHAARQFRIEKRESGGRVATTIRELSSEERVEELARMLAGDRVTDAARENAREMLGL